MSKNFTPPIDATPASSQSEDLETLLQREEQEIDAAPEVSASQRNLRPFDGFAGGNAEATPRDVDGVPFADLD